MMKAIRLGLGLAAGYLALLWLALSVPAQAAPIPQSGAGVLNSSAAPSPEAVISQQSTLVLTATVGSSPTTCGITRTLQVRRDTVVYPCFAVENRGVITLSLHRIASQRQGVITDSLPLTLGPGAATNTLGLGLVLTDVTSFDVTDLVTWTARTLTPTQLFTATDRFTIDVITPTLSIYKTVGIDRTTCPATQNLRVPTGSTVYYCLRVENQGDEAFTRHELVDAALNLDATLIYTVPPGATWVITSGVLADLGVNGSLLQRANVNAPFTNTVTLTSSTASGLSARAASTATIDVGTTTVVFTKTVGTEPEVCSHTANMSLPLGTPLYYCVSILNTGVVTLTRHSLSEPNLAIDITFDYPLPPGELLTITNRVLTETLGQLAVFGPFNYSGAYPAVVNNSMTYSATSTEGDGVTSSAATQVNPPPTATPTHTPAPRPANTNTPFPTNTPGPTNTPIPPTPSPTPTFTPETPTATPTRSYAVSALATPTPTPLSQAAAQATAEAAMMATATMQSSMAQTDPLSPDVALMTGTPDASAPISPLPGGQPDAAALAVAAEELSEEAMNGEGVPPVETAVPISSTEATPPVVVIVVTEPPDPPDGSLDPLRPVVPPTPTPTPDYLLAAATAIDAMVAAAGWIWFLTGSLIFFLTAGVVAGFFLRYQGVEHFELEPWADEAYGLTEMDVGMGEGADDEFIGREFIFTGEEFTGEAGPDVARGEPDEDDEWPAHLP